MSITKLTYFDFDSTLFRSPDQPKWWKKSDGLFFRDVISLSEPFVPEVPGKKWWVPDVVESAIADSAHPYTYTVVATGRGERFRNRVTQLVTQKGLDFDEIHLNPGTETGYYKGTLLFQLVHKFPDLEEVELWDDREDLLHAYFDILSAMGLPVVAHHVTVPAMSVQVKSRITFRVARRYFQQKCL